MARKPTQIPTFWPIKRRDWPARTAAVQGISVSDTDGLSLAARRDEAGRPEGPLALDWPDGSLGGLVLPTGLAQDEAGGLFLLDPDPPWCIRRYYQAAGEFRPLPGLGGPGRDDPRRFHHPANIAVCGSLLYVADRGNHRIAVFDLRTLGLRYLWEESRYDPVDVAVGGGRVWLLGAAGILYHHLAGRDWPESLLKLPGDPGRWRRLAIDRAGRLYIRAADPDGTALHVFAPDGTPLEVVQDAGEVRGRFDPPAVRLTFNRRLGARPNAADGFFELSPALAADCAPEPDAGPGPQVFDRRGRRVTPDPAEMAPIPAYGRHGVWIGGPLDSDIDTCQWHRVILNFDRLPPGSRLIVSTLSADNPTTAPDKDDRLWLEGFRLAGEPARPDPPPQPADFLVQSRPGQYLWLKVVLEGDGFESPRLRGLEAHFPRQSYLGYLPAIYAAEDESRWFLERFLSIFQTEWDDLERRIAQLPIYFNPDTVPGGPFLRELARWLALPLEETWTDEQQRNLLRLVGRFYPHRGTAAGLRLFVQAYLQNMTGLSPEAQGSFPHFLEGYRRRSHLMLAGTSQAGGRLWSDAIVNRLQTDSGARVGDARLVDTGDPPRDFFHVYAHRFLVSLPAAWVRSASDESMLRRALDAEKPAHTEYELRLVGARLRVEVQSTVGIDTIVGGIPAARLACAAVAQTAAPGAPPRYRLGYDMVLSGPPRPGRPLPFQTTRL